MKLNEALKYRYSTKKFDSEKKITQSDMQEIKDLLRLSPSSVNSQPWHFIIAESKEAKERISKSTGGFYAFNKEKVLDASAVVVFLSKKEMDDEHLSKLTAQEDKDGRFMNEEIKLQNDAGRKAFNNIHKKDLKDDYLWLEKQVYLNLGSFLIGLGVMGIDSVPMEGFDAKILSEEFDLDIKGLTPLVLVPIGYRSEEDYNANLNKSRLPEEDIFTLI